jgi:hypothetical protein
MTSPSDGVSFRSRWLSQSHSQGVITECDDLEKKIVQDHLSEGWTQEENSTDNFIFSIYLQDGRKWTRHYDRKTCQFISQRFYNVEHVAKSTLKIEWPNIDFGD